MNITVLCSNRWCGWRAAKRPHVKLSDHLASVFTLGHCNVSKIWVVFTSYWLWASPVARVDCGQWSWCQGYLICPVAKWVMCIGFLEQHEAMLEKTTPGTMTWYPESQALSTRLAHSCDLFPWRVDFSHVIKSADFCTLGLGRAVSPGLPTRD